MTSATAPGGVSLSQSILRMSPLIVGFLVLAIPPAALAVSW